MGDGSVSCHNRKADLLRAIENLVLTEEEPVS